jgi:hypothetical protein
VRDGWRRAKIIQKHHVRREQVAPFNTCQALRCIAQLIRHGTVDDDMGLIVGGWPMMVRDGPRRAKIIWMAHVKDKTVSSTMPKWHPN